MEEHEYETMASVEDHHFWFVSMRALVREVFLSARFPRDAVILDVGCGTGGTMNALQGLARFAGVDMSLTAARFTTRRTGNPVVCGLGTRLPFADASVDGVLALDVFEHIADDAAAVAEVRRVLRPGGALIATVPCHPALFSEHDRALHHVRRYTHAGFLDLLRSGGFRPERVTWTMSLLFPAVAVFRMFERVRGLSHPYTRSDAALRVGPLNAALRAVMRVERGLLRRFDLPFGLSLLVVAR